MSLYPFPNQRYTSQLGLALYGMDEVLAENMLLIDGTFSAGSTINVNSVLVSAPNFNNTTPAAPLGDTNVVWQVDINGNVSAYVPSSGGGAVSSVFGRTGAVVAVSGDYSYAQISGTPQLPVTKAAITSNWLNSYSSITGLFTATQPNYTDIAGTVPTPPSGSVLWSSLGNAAANLTLANANFNTTFNQTSAVAWTWANTTVGTVGSTNASPLLELAANYWATGNVTGVDLWTVGIAALTAGLNSPSTLTFTHTGSTGSAAVRVPLLDIGGTDAGISRLGAASLAIGNGTAGDFSGTLTLKNFGVFTSAGFGFNIARNTGTGNLDILNTQTPGTYGIHVNGVGVFDGAVTSAGNTVLYNGIGSATIGSIGSPSTQTSRLTLIGGSATTGLAFDAGSSTYTTIWRDSSTGYLVFTGRQGGADGYAFNTANAPNAFGINANGGITIGATDVGISRLGAASLAIGNGAAGNTTGNLSYNRINTAGIDHAGTATITAAATSVTVTYAANYTGAAAPVVVVTPTSDPLALGVPVGYWVVATGVTTAWTGFTISIQTALAGNVTFGYIVIGKA